jgi:HD-like signal output (HDOD) protein
MTETFVRPQTPWALRLVPPFPSVAQRIMTLAAQDNSNAQQVANLVKFDPSFSAELLRFANSALFGVRRSVSGLTQAIVLLGLDRVKTLATLVVMNRMVRSSVKIEALRKVWIHSLATALIAEEAAPRMRVCRDTGYTAGLMHNLGALGLMSAYPDAYSKMLEVSNDYGFDLLNTERDLFEIDHCEAGCYLAQDWDFPDELAASMATHHDEPAPGEIGLDTLVQFSWRLADALGFAAFSPEKERGYEELAAYLPAAVGISWLNKNSDEVRGELAVRLAEAGG